MAIKKEREAFLNVYVNYKGDSRKIQFNEETEQFMWRKNNVSDTEVEYVHLMNQRWYAWLACAKSKTQAVPEGFVLVKMDDLELLRDSALEIKYASLSNDSDRIFSDIEDIQLSVERLIELQEPTND